MGKLALLIFVIVAPTIAGILVTVALASPGLGFDSIARLWMVVAAGAVISIPVSIWLGSMLNKQFGGKG